MFYIQRTILQMMMAKWLKRDYVIIDTESTGLLSDYGRVYEVCKLCIDAERQRWEEEDEERW